MVLAQIAFLLSGFTIDFISGFSQTSSLRMHRPQVHERLNCSRRLMHTQVFIQDGGIMILKRRPVRSRVRRVVLSNKKLRFEQLRKEAQDLSNILHYLREDLEKKDSVLMPQAAAIRSEHLH